MTSPLRRTILLAIVVASSSMVPARAAAEQVGVKDYEFTPSAIMINAGDEVVWSCGVSGDCADVQGHDVTADDGSFESPNMRPGSTFRHTFEEAGTFEYHCSIHPSLMTGTVTVQGAAPSEDPTPSQSASPTPSKTKTKTPTPSETPTETPTPSESASASPSGTASTAESTTAVPTPGPTETSDLEAAGDTSIDGGSGAGPALIILAGILIAGAAGMLIKRRRTS